MKKIKWIGMMSIILLFISCKKDEKDSVAWEQKSNLPAKARIGAVGFAINGTGYVGLGMWQESRYSNQPEYLNDLWSYNPATDQWMEKAPFPGSGRMGAIAFVVDGKVYAGGGTGERGAVNDFWEYDPIANEWNLAIGMDDTRYYAIGFAVGEKGYAGLGAYCDRQNNFIILNDFWSYTPNQYEWTKLADFPGNPRIGASVFTVGRKAYITAGCNSDQPPVTYYSDTYEYDTDNNRWTQKKDLPSKQCRNASGFSINGYGYVAFVNGNELWQYNPDTDQWTQKERFPAGYAFNTACFVIDNKAYFVSDGENKNLNANELWVYEASKDK